MGCFREECLNAVASDVVFLEIELAQSVASFEHLHQGLTVTSIQQVGGRVFVTVSIDATSARGRLMSEG